MRKRNLFYLFIFLGIVFFVFRHWFLYPLIIGGDWPYYFDGFLESFSVVPILWAPWQGNGLGGVNPLLGLHVFSSSLIVPFVNWLGLPWEVVYKVGWFGLFLALSVYGSKRLWEAVDSRQQKTDSFPWWMVASIIYTTNTYILMVTGGGQMGVAISYGIAPLVLTSFIKLIQSVSDAVVNVKSPFGKTQDRQKSPPKADQPLAGKVKNVLSAGLILGFQLMIDPRIAYVTMVGVGIYYISNFKFQISNFVSAFIVSLIVAAGVNAFWLLPMVVMRNNPLKSLGSAFTSIDSIRFYSFADFSHALSLLHPNWPENVFGKTFFLQPEFLFLPLLAFSSLLYCRKNKNIFFFITLALIGVFFAKGAQEPFGIVYQWMFIHVPGFVMFRDPTKFYLLIALSYSILIPFALEQFVLWRRIKNQELRIMVSTLVVCLFVFLWIFTIREAILGQLSGTFEKHTVPQEYRELEGFLQTQPNSARTLWVPRQQRFSYGTLDSMPVEAEPLFGATTAAQLKVKLENPTSMELLGDLGIGYVIIPYDSLGELFLQDRKYDEKKRQEYESVLDGISWFKKIRSGKLTIYQTPRHGDLFWVLNDEALTYKRIRPDRYTVSFTVREPSTVYFSQAYHQGWVFKAGDTRMKSQRSSNGLNSFQILTPGTYEGVVEFEPQKYVTWGLAVSFLTVLGAALAFML